MRRPLKMPTIYSEYYNVQLASDEVIIIFSTNRKLLYLYLSQFIVGIETKINFKNFIRNAIVDRSAYFDLLDHNVFGTEHSL